MRMGMKVNKQSHRFKCQDSSPSRILQENYRKKYFHFIQKDPTASLGKQQAAFSPDPASPHPLHPAGLALGGSLRLSLGRPPALLI